MEVFRPDAGWEPAEARHFTGGVRLIRRAPASPGPATKLFRVRFDPRARTNWHAHTGPQWLFVVEGACRVQSWGRAAFDLQTGDAVCIAPGEKHWHGATPDGPMTHLALNLDTTTEWLEAVSEEDYGG